MTSRPEQSVDANGNVLSSAEEQVVLVNEKDVALGSMEKLQARLAKLEAMRNAAESLRTRD